jgi:hypothetical protein
MYHTAITSSISIRCGRRVLYPRTAGYHQITVYHDDECGIFEGRRCDCDPDIKLRFSLDGHEN